MNARPVLRLVLAGAAARLAYAGLRRRPPGEEKTWTKINHRGEPLTLLEGPAVATGAVAAALAAPGLDGATRSALALAGAVAGAVGCYDDLVGNGDRRGFRGDLGALAKGEITTGAIKIAGIGAAGLAVGLVRGERPAGRPLTGLAAEQLTRSAAGQASGLIVSQIPGSGVGHVGRTRPGGGYIGRTRPGFVPGSDPAHAGGSGQARAVDVVINAGLVAGTANLMNLFDLRPGRAIKVTLLASLALAAGGRQARAGAAGPAGAALALLPEDLGERAMLGDAGANALGAMLGAAAAATLPRTARVIALAAIGGLTAASEKVSFTKVIARTPPLNWLDMLCLRPAAVPATADPSSRPEGGTPLGADGGPTTPDVDGESALDAGGDPAADAPSP